GLGIAEGLERYRVLVERYRHAYRILRVAQWVCERTPTAWFVALTGLAGRRPVLPRWWPRYGWFGRFDPDPAGLAGDRRGRRRIGSDHARPGGAGRRRHGGRMRVLCLARVDECAALSFPP